METIAAIFLIFFFFKSLPRVLEILSLLCYMQMKNNKGCYRYIYQIKNHSTLKTNVSDSYWFSTVKHKPFKYIDEFEYFS